MTTHSWRPDFQLGASPPAELLLPEAAPCVGPEPPCSPQGLPRRSFHEHLLCGVELSHDDLGLESHALGSMCATRASDSSWWGLCFPICTRETPSGRPEAGPLTSVLTAAAGDARRGPRATLPRGALLLGVRGQELPSPWTPVFCLGISWVQNTPNVPSLSKGQPHIGGQLWLESPLRRIHQHQTHTTQHPP